MIKRGLLNSFCDRRCHLFRELIRWLRRYSEANGIHWGFAVLDTGLIGGIGMKKALQAPHI